MTKVVVSPLCDGRKPMTDLTSDPNLWLFNKFLGYMICSKFSSLACQSFKIPSKLLVRLKVFYSPQNLPSSTSLMSSQALGPSCSTNTPTNVPDPTPVRNLRLETINIPFLQRVSMTLVRRKLVRKPSSRDRTRLMMI